MNNSFAGGAEQGIIPRSIEFLLQQLRWQESQQSSLQPEDRVKYEVKVCLLSFELYESHRLTPETEPITALSSGNLLR